MKFFSGSTSYTYPDDPHALREEILKDAVKSPQKKTVSYFEFYFLNGGTAAHPLLGDLEVLATEIERSSDKANGLNLTVGLIRNRLKSLQSTPEQKLDTGVHAINP